VVVPGRPVSGITPARIAPLRYLDECARPSLDSTVLTLVGYGTEVRQASTGPQNPEPRELPDRAPLHRRGGPEAHRAGVADQPQREGPRGGGGTCLRWLRRTVVVQGRLRDHGDQLRVHEQLPARGGLQRVDIPAVQSRLATMGVRP